MTKTRVAALVLLAILLGWMGWLAFRDRTAGTPTEARRAVEETKPGSAPEGPAKERAAGAAIRPRSVAERDDEAAASSRSSAGPTSAATGATGSIVGEVLAPDGSPVEGALVIAGDPETECRLGEGGLRVHLSSVTTFTRAPDVHKVTTSAKGTFRFDDIAPAAGLTVAAQHADLGLAAMFRIPLRAGEERFVTLRFEAGVRFFGRVTDHDMRPIPSPKLRMTGFKEGAGSTDYFADVDNAGNYRFEPAAGSQFSLSASESGYYAERAFVKDLPPETREHRVDFVLERAPLLRGRLVLADGSPAGAAEHLKDLFGGAAGGDRRQELALLAAFDDPRKEPNFRSINHDEGRVLPGEDEYELTPESKGIKYLSLWLDQDLIGLAELASPDVAPDIVVDWSKASRPKPRGTLEIVVRSRADRAPVANYDVRITGPCDAPMNEQITTGAGSIAADGRVRFDPLVAGRYHVTVTAAGFDDARTWVDLKAGPDVMELFVELVPAAQSPATAAVSGTVRGPNGAPINGATVWLLSERAERPADAPAARTDVEGSFRFERLMPESYVVLVHAPPETRLAPAWTRALAPTTAVVVTLAEGVQVRLVAEGTPGPSSFRILDSAGVVVLDDLRTETDRWGASHQVILAPGTYDVHASCPGFTPVRASFLAAEGASVTLKFERAPK